MNLIKTLCLLIVLVVSFCSCSLIDFFSAESLLRPPKLTGEKAALQAAFEASVGSDISLYTPISGENRASYIFFDANSDGNDEAVVFYSLNSNSSVVHMHLLSQKNGEWYSVFDITGSGTEIYKVDFYNIDNSHNLEIAVIWSVDDSKKEKTLSFYRINSLDSESDNAIISLATIQIADCFYIDIDSDSACELLYLFYADSEDQFAVNARLLDYDSNENILVPLSEVALPGQIASCVQFDFDKENNDFRFYLECLAPDNSVFTEILVYSNSNGALYIPNFDESSIIEYTTRPYKIYSQDYNKDGYIDIPFYCDFADSYVISGNNETALQLIFIEWFSYLEGEFSSLGKCFINEYDGFVLDIDDLYEYYYIVYDEVNNITQVRLKNLDEENNIIFSVSVNKELNNEHLILGDGFLTDKDKTEYTIIISAKGESMNITKAYVESLISDI